VIEEAQRKIKFYFSFSSLKQIFSSNAQVEKMLKKSGIPDIRNQIPEKIIGHGLRILI